MVNKILETPNKKALGALSVGHLTVDTYGGFINPIMPVIATKLGISLGIVGLLLTIANIASAVLQPIFGYISDLLYRRFFIFTGLIMASIFVCFVGVVNNIWILALILFLGYLGVGFFHPQATSLAGYFSGREINKLMGTFTAFGTAGYALGPIISASLVETFGLSSLLFTMPFGLIIAYIIYKLLPKIPISIAKQEKVSFIAVIKEIAVNKNLVLLSFLAFVKSLIVITFIIFIPFLWKQHNYSIMLIGTAISAFSIFGGISSYIGGILTNILGKKTVFFLSLLLMSPCLIGTLFFTDKMPYLSIVLFAMAGFMNNLSVAVNIVMAQEAIPENKALISGIIGGFSWGLAGIIQTPLGFIGAKAGIEPVLLIVSFTPLLASIAIPFIRENA